MLKYHVARRAGCNMSQRLYTSPVNQLKYENETQHLLLKINFYIHFVSLINPVSIHLLIHLSTHLAHPSIIHSFTPGSKPTFSTYLFHLVIGLP